MRAKQHTHTHMFPLVTLRVEVDMESSPLTPLWHPEVQKMMPSIKTPELRPGGNSVLECKGSTQDQVQPIHASADVTLK